MIDDADQERPHPSDQRVVRIDFQRADDTEEPRPPRRRIGRVLHELRQRRVCRAVMTYGLAVWLVLQIADVAFPLLGVPEAVLRLLVTIGALGLPVAVVLAWVFELTPDGLVVDSPRRLRVRRTGAGRDVTINCALLVLGIAGALLLSTRLLIDEPEPALGVDAALQQRLAIGVLPVDLARQQAPQSDRLLSLRFESELRRRFITLDVVSVVDPSEATGQQRAPTLLLTVDFHTAGQEVRLLVRLVNALTGAYLLSTSIQTTRATVDGTVDLIAREVERALAPPARPGIYPPAKTAKSRVRQLAEGA